MRLSVYSCVGLLVCWFNCFVDLSFLVHVSVYVCVGSSGGCFVCLFMYSGDGCVCV